MKLTSSLRTPYRSRAIVPLEATNVREDARLESAIVVTQLALMALCAVRAGTDLFCGPLTIEGGIASLTFVALAAALLAKAIGRLVGDGGAQRRRTRAFFASTRRARSSEHAEPN